MSLISLVRCPSYDPDELTPALARLLEPLGGMEAFVRPGQSVLIKPNLLCARPPQSAVTTHPALVLAVGRLALQAGGQPFIADSPALEPFGLVAKKSGLAQAARELGIPILELSDPTPAPASPLASFKGLALARQALEADVVVNLPKFKTHVQMLMTLAVKNLFGTVVAQRKSEWHLVAGLDAQAFASLLLDICQAVNPALSIVDGVWGMEGAGPSNGQPRQLGLLAASSDPLALDLRLARLAGVNLEEFPLYLAARAKGLLTPERLDPALTGDPPPELAAPGWQLPPPRSIRFLPHWLDWFSQRHLVSRPVQDQDRCQACGQCQKICPAGCLVLEGRRASFDYDRCIRCYCCQEVCPADAITLRQGGLARVLGLLRR